MAHRVTIADVAKAAGVSQQTISRVLNDKGEVSEATRQRVRAVIDRLGYRPSSIARGLATHRTLTIGLVVPDVANPFFSEIARGAADAAHAAGYSVLLCNTVEDPKREIGALHTLEEKRVDGVVLCSSRLPVDDLQKLVTRLPAVVLVNRQLPDVSTGTVRVDDAAGARLAVRHLLALGRHTIGFLAGPPVSQSGRERARGFEEALAEAGLPRVPGLIRACTPYLEGGREATAALLAAHPGIDALFCYNDLVAVGALAACAEMSCQVPENVAVVGCDDTLLAGLVTPSLTTLHVPQRELGATAVDMLLKRIGGCVVECAEIVLQPQLIVRTSAPWHKQ